MDLSIALAPTPETPSQIALAEQLGYSRAWVFDTPALQLDVWMTLAIAATRTTRIGLGPGVFVPSLRHPMVTATAIAHLCSLAPGRVRVGVGAGRTGRRALGQKALRWSDMVQHIRQTQGLLAGEIVEIDAGASQMLHWPGHAPERPIDVPWQIAVAGPKGLATARELGMGVFTSRPMGGPEYAGFPSITALVGGTVLRSGEALDDPRVLASAGPVVAVAYRGLYERGGLDKLPSMPNGARYVELLEALPAATRHLHLHPGHLTQLNDIDREIVDAEAIKSATLLHTAEEVPAWVASLEAMGVTEIAFMPAGNIESELESLAAAFPFVQREPHQESSWKK
jgi:5,10-methylenetetrahydromethanopterin reductase